MVLVSARCLLPFFLEESSDLRFAGVFSVSPAAATQCVGNSNLAGLQE